MNPHQHIRVLHIEDNTVQAQLLQKILGSTGGSFEVTRADRLEQGIRLFTDQAFDVVLLDLTLPDYQGWETVTRAREAMPKAPIVVLTSLEDDVFGAQCAEAGVQDFLLKGEVNGPSLRRILIYAIERKRKEESLRQSEEELRKRRDHLEKLVQERTSELTRLNEQLLQAQKMEAIGRLSGGIAHDFNNLLSMMSGYATFLTESLGREDPRRSDAQEICHIIERATALTRQLLTFSRKQPAQFTTIDLGAVVSGMEDMLRRLIGEHIDLRLTVDPTPHFIKADMSQVEQILFNLLVNAGDAMPKGGVLEISSAAVMLEPQYAISHANVIPVPYIRLSVSDTGCGMDAKTLSHLFEPFFTTKEKGKGTGLGLATVYGIVNQSGGYVDVLSQPGKGTTFHIYFPQVQEVPKALKDSLEPVGDLEGTETILFVEDEAVVRAVARRALEAHGYKVLEAADGIDAMKIVQDQAGHIDLVVTDIIMPGLGGIDLADHLSSLHPMIRILFLSGYTADTVPGRDLGDSSCSFLAKPFSPQALVQKVRWTLDRPAVSSTHS